MWPLKEDLDLIRIFLSRFYNYAGAKMGLVLLLMVAMGLTQGVGLFMLIPLLSLAGVGGDLASSEMLFEGLSGLFGGLGLQTTLPVLLCFYMLIIIIFSVLQYWEKQLSEQLQHGFACHLRSCLFDALIHSEWLFISRCQSSDLLHLLTQAIRQIQVGTQAFLILLSGIILLSFQLCLAFWVSAQITSLVLFCSIGMAFLLRSFNRSTHRAGKELLANTESLFATSAEFIGGVKIAKSYNRISRHLEHFAEYNHRIKKGFLAFARFTGKTAMFYQVGAALMLSIFLYLATEVYALPVAHLLLMVVIFSRFLPKMSDLNQKYQNLLGMLPAFESIYFWQKRFKAHQEKDAPDDGLAKFPTEKITFRDVSFRYVDDGKNALEDISLNFPVGKITAVVGRSGAGKSTLVDLLMGLILPTRGTILLDKVSLNSMSRACWGRNVGYVPQETYLFHDTIKANLLWAQPDASDDELWETLALAQADDFIRSLPQGLDTSVGDRGVGISGGERQRIALARALLRRPALLVLDEATSALDEANEDQIVKVLERLKGALTIVVVAHRSAVLAVADQVVTLEQGRVVDSGEAG